ncbi:hypothetical protein [Alkalitalea saponilacus]|uniref:Uncharacterized protein n=1 Tax=Alkalitalea saponilacus TaxID=889453 RepID=A0A1T5EY45_9BACT|nr:hypothetical protein [Alkalitalea saponilacus]ASB47973.1 hypothetical protein CDL62_01795 [Alkalitalea saponilacus]SKB88857.1 hypothetical protein SAMN03080601_01456 [Alkalitalea saponilacus]
MEENLKHTQTIFQLLLLAAMLTASNMAISGCIKTLTDSKKNIPVINCPFERELLPHALNHKLRTLLSPTYILAKFNTDSGQQHKAKQILEEIPNCPVIIKTPATREIVYEIKKLVTQSFTEKTQRSSEVFIEKLSEYPCNKTR